MMTVFDCAHTVQQDKPKTTAWVSRFEQAALGCDTDFINLTFFISVLKISCREASAKRVGIKEIISLSGYSKSTFFRRYRSQGEFWTEMRALAHELFIEFLEENFTTDHEVNDKYVSDLLGCIQDINNTIFSFIAHQGEEPIDTKVAYAYQLCLAIEDAFKGVYSVKLAKHDVNVTQLCKLLHIIMVDELVINRFFTSTPQKGPPPARPQSLIGSRANLFLALN